jgi:deferrochelatase/peroxidase EfeB
MPPRPDPGNVQGLILRGYAHHPYSCHMLFTFPDLTGAAQFVRALMPYVQTGQDWGSNMPLRMLNIGLTYSGIMIFDVDSKLAGQFPYEFQSGPWSDSSQESLFDAGTDDPSDPSLWWNGLPDPTLIHCIVHSYGLTADALSGLVEIVSQAAEANRLTEVLPLKSGGRLEEYAPLGNFIHFGYHDGIDNPDLGWPKYQEDTVPSDLNNFVIGYPGSNSQPGPQGATAAAAFAKDGCYNAFRIFYQDVEAFDQFLAGNALAVANETGRSPDDAKEWLAAKLVGRWRNGSPLVLSPDAPDPKTSDCKNFGYSADTAGLRCPFSAHSRVANPRDEPTFPGTDTPVPRISRRGMPYGAPPVPPDYSGERGLIGLFLCGSLVNQFEKLYTWINTNDFSSVFSSPTQDALLANRVPPADGNNSDVDPSFTIPVPNGNPIVIPTMPQFLVTRGTAYCLLPSIATLQQLAGMAK